MHNSSSERYAPFLAHPHKIIIFSVHINVCKKRGSCWRLGQAPFRRKKEEAVVTSFAFVSLHSVSKLITEKITFGM